jgi:hypothetical protein
VYQYSGIHLKAATSAWVILNRHFRGGTLVPGARSLFCGESLPKPDFREVARRHRLAADRSLSRSRDIATPSDRWSYIICGIVPLSLESQLFAPTRICTNNVSWSRTGVCVSRGITLLPTRHNIPTYQDLFSFASQQEPPGLDIVGRPTRMVVPCVRMRGLIGAQRLPQEGCQWSASNSECSAVLRRSHLFPTSFEKRATTLTTEELHRVAGT